MSAIFSIDRKQEMLDNGRQHEGNSSILPETSASTDKSELSTSLNFLFVNTNQREGILDRRKINRRVQQNTFIKRKEKSAQSLNAALFRLSGKSSYCRQETPEHVSAERQWPQSTSLTTGIDGSLDYDAPSARSYLDSRRINPFGSGNISMTPEMESMFMYYFSAIMPAVEPVQAEREDYNRWLVPLTMAEPALLYSLIACMAQDIEQSSAVGFGLTARRNMVTQRVQYKLQAIRALNECLANPKTAKKPSTLIAVHFLLWQEIFAGDECIHMDGIRRLLELRGGFNGVQRKAIEAIMVGSFWRAIRTRTKPVLPQVLDELPVSQMQISDLVSTCDPSLAKLGEGFLDPGLKRHFDEEMFQLLQDARTIWIFFERIGIHDFPIAEKRLISIKRVNLDHRLLSYPFDHYSEHRPIQEVCRQAIIIYSNAHYNVIQPSSQIARCLVEDLKKALEETDLPSCWGTANQALLWVLFQGAHMSFGQRERPWFVTALARVAQTLPSRDWVRVRLLLMRFYYSDRVFQDSFRRIWDEVGLLTSILPDWF